MPTVRGKKYPYTPGGMRSARAAAAAPVRRRRKPAASATRTVRRPMRRR